MLKAASVALLEMPSQLLGAADRNGPHHLLLRGGQAMRSSVALPVLAKDIGQFGARLFSPAASSWLASSMTVPGYSEQSRRSSRSKGLVVEPSLGWRICR